jgi:hypothetical protein
MKLINARLYSDKRQNLLGSTVQTGYLFSHNYRFCPTSTFMVDATALD